MTTAAALPVARCCLDLPQVHLDRLFDYQLTAQTLAEAAVGVRVRVPFAGRLVSGYLIEIAERSQYSGRLAPLRQIVSNVPVLSPPIWQLAGTVAQRLAGSSADVLRLAIPPRRAHIERDHWPDLLASAAPSPANQPVGQTGNVNVASDASQPYFQVWQQYDGGPAFLKHLADAAAPRAVFSALPWGATAAGQAPGWMSAIIGAVVATLRSGRTASVSLPEVALVNQLEPLLKAAVVAEQWASSIVARLVAEDGPGERYRSFLSLLAGQSLVALGTRSAVWAPLEKLGLAVIWDDCAGTHREQRAPFPHSRQVLAWRCTQQQAGLLIGGVGRSVQAQWLLEAGWAKQIKARRQTLRAVAPHCWVPDQTSLGAQHPGIRLPGVVHRMLQRQLLSGPVLIQVPRAGYLHSLACVRCRTAARCGHCHGPLTLPSQQANQAVCSWCGQLTGASACPQCGAVGWRSVQIGARRTAEEFGRAFAGVPVVLSSAEASHGVIAQVGSEPAVVVATPRAEPTAPGGYAAAALLDGWLTSAVGGLEASVLALGRWLAAACLVRPAAAGGVVALVGEPALRPAQALVRWDPQGLAARELAERQELGLPPSVILVAITGAGGLAEQFVATIDITKASFTILGPMPVDSSNQRCLLKTSLDQGRKLVQAVRAARARWYMASNPGIVRIEVDPEL